MSTPLRYAGTHRLRHLTRNFQRDGARSCWTRGFATEKDGVSDLQSPRWLNEVRARIGKCISFGLNKEQIAETGTLVRTLAKEWRVLLAGPEGFLTYPKRAGLLRHPIVWGELDSMGHVNNVVYNRWAESARIEWVQNFARTFDQAHAQEWRELWTPKGDGMILRSIKTDFKFVSSFVYT